MTEGANHLAPPIQILFPLLLVTGPYSRIL